MFTGTTSEEKPLAKPEKQTKILDTQNDKAAIEQQLDAYHFAIHTHETREDELLVMVRRALTFDDKNYTHFKKTDEKNRDTTYKIRISDYVAIYQSNFTQLYAYLEEAIKQIVGFDFDETLTITHTYPGEIISRDITPRDPKDNMRFEAQTKAVLEAIRQKNNIILTIVSVNNEDRIDINLKAWYPKENDPFNGKVYGRETTCTKAEAFKKIESQSFRKGLDFFGKPDTDKRKYDFNSTVGKMDTADKRRIYLKLGLKKPILMVVRCLLIDDTVKHCNSCAERGIDPLLADTKDNSHLLTLNQRFNLGLELQAQTLEESLKPKSIQKDSLTSASHAASAKLTADAFESWANPDAVPQGQEKQQKLAQITVTQDKQQSFQSPGFHI